MTLKQFFQVAGGAIIALIFYSSGLPSYVKWPLIISSFLFGVALAFFPLEDRPLETWIFSFLKTVYSPTLFLWKKLEQKPSFFQAEPSAAAGVIQPSLQPLVQGATLANVQEPAVVAPGLEKGEQEFLSKVTEHFSAPVAVPSPVPIVPKPSVQNAQPVRKGVKVAESKPLRIEPKVEKPRVFLKPSRLASFGTSYLSPSMGQMNEGVLSAKFSPDAAPPVPPSKSNIIVGQVMDPDGGIVENAILEIKDEDGRSVRALKSNKLGHFMIVTPLANGKYQITIEAEGLAFDPVSLEVKGEIVLPIAVRAKKAK